MSRDIFHQTRLLRAPSNLALNTAREGAATASLGNLCQCLTTSENLFKYGVKICVLTNGTQLFILVS